MPIMLKECVLNELAILAFDTQRQDRLLLLEQLAKLPKIVGARLSLWKDLRDPSTEAGHRFGEFWHAARQASAGASERDQLRRLGSFFAKAEEFDTTSSDDVRFGEDLAHGLGRAYRIRGLALSLRSASSWIEPWLPVTIESMAFGATEIDRKPGRVRHASTEAHLAEHDDWGPLDEIDRLRICLETTGATHMPASSYSRGKHVRGMTNEERANNARGPSGQGQYLALEGESQVSDDRIRQWEEEALARVKSKSSREYTVEYHGGRTFYIFCDMGETVGYEGSTGEPISRVRVEWSSGTVHSHPRRPPA